jgi:hypothetical protein
MAIARGRSQHGTWRSRQRSRHGDARRSQHGDGYGNRSMAIATRSDRGMATRDGIARRSMARMAVAAWQWQHASQHGAEEWSRSMVATEVAA